MYKGITKEIFRLGLRVEESWGVGKTTGPGGREVSFETRSLQM